MASLAGCSSTGSAADTPASTTTTLVSRSGGTLSLGIDQSFTGCNPNTAAGDTWANQTVLEPVLPSAFVASPTGQEVLDQAVVEQAEPVSLSPETIVYTINPKAVWSDGVPITAADFIYAWHQQRGSTRTAPAADATTSTLGYRDIKSITGSHHGRTVTVVFRTLFSDWQMLFHELLPAHVMSKVGWDVACNAPDPAVDLSGGPFRIVSARQDQVVLGSNAHWWGRPAQLHHLAVDVARSTPELSQWLADGRVQAVQPSSFGSGFLEAATTTPSIDSSLLVGATFLELQFATTSTALQDAAVRQAVARSVNRQGLVNRVVGFASAQITPAASHLYAQSQSQYPTVPTGSTPPFPLDADPTDAAKLFASADYTRSASGAWLQPDGKPLTLRLEVDAGNGWALTTSHYLVSQLERAGIGVTVSLAPDTRTAGLALAAGAADMALLPMQASPFPTQALAWYTPDLGPPGQGGSEDWSQLDNPTLTATLVKAAKELNPATAQPMYQQADQLLWNVMAALPLFTVPVATAWSDRAGGVGPNRFGSLLWYAQIWSVLVPSTASSGASAGS